MNVIEELEKEHVGELTAEKKCAGIFRRRYVARQRESR